MAESSGGGAAETEELSFVAEQILSEVTTSEEWTRGLSEQPELKNKVKAALEALAERVAKSSHGVAMRIAQEHLGAIEQRMSDLIKIDQEKDGDLREALETARDALRERKAADERRAAEAARVAELQATVEAQAQQLERLRGAAELASESTTAVERMLDRLKETEVLQGQYRDAMDKSGKKIDVLTQLTDAQRQRIAELERALRGGAEPAAGGGAGGSSNAVPAGADERLQDALRKLEMVERERDLLLEAKRRQATEEQEGPREDAHGEPLPPRGMAAVEINRETLEAQKTLRKPAPPSDGAPSDAATMGSKWPTRGGPARATGGTADDDEDDDGGDQDDDDDGSSGGGGGSRDEGHDDDALDRHALAEALVTLKGLGFTDAQIEALAEEVTAEQARDLVAMTAKLREVQREHDELRAIAEQRAQLAVIAEAEGEGGGGEGAGPTREAVRRRVAAFLRGPHGAQIMRDAGLGADQVDAFVSFLEQMGGLDELLQAAVRAGAMEQGGAIEVQQDSSSSSSDEDGQDEDGDGVDGGREERAAAGASAPPSPPRRVRDEEEEEEEEEDAGGEEGEEDAMPAAARERLRAMEEQQAQLLEVLQAVMALSKEQAKQVSDYEARINDVVSEMGRVGEERQRWRETQARNVQLEAENARLRRGAPAAPGEPSGGQGDATLQRENDALKGELGKAKDALRTIRGEMETTIASMMQEVRGLTEQQERQAEMHKRALADMARAYKSEVDAIRTQVLRAAAAEGAGTGSSEADARAIAGLRRQLDDLAGWKEQAVGVVRVLRDQVRREASGAQELRQKLDTATDSNGRLRDELGAVAERLGAVTRERDELEDLLLGSPGGSSDGGDGVDRTDRDGKPRWQGLESSYREARARVAELEKEKRHWELEGARLRHEALILRRKYARSLRRQGHLQDALIQAGVTGLATDLPPGAVSRSARARASAAANPSRQLPVPGGDDDLGDGDHEDQAGVWASAEGEADGLGDDDEYAFDDGSDDDGDYDAVGFAYEPLPAEPRSHKPSAAAAAAAAENGTEGDVDVVRMGSVAAGARDAPPAVPEDVWRLVREYEGDEGLGRPGTAAPSDLRRRGARAAEATAPPEVVNLAAELAGDEGYGRPGSALASDRRAWLQRRVPADVEERAAALEGDEGIARPPTAAPSERRPWSGVSPRRTAHTSARAGATGVSSATGAFGSSQAMHNGWSRSDSSSGDNPPGDPAPLSGWAVDDNDEGDAEGDLGGSFGSAGRNRELVEGLRDDPRIGADGFPILRDAMAAARAHKTSKGAKKRDGSARGRGSRGTPSKSLLKATAAGCDVYPTRDDAERVEMAAAQLTARVPCKPGRPATAPVGEGGRGRSRGVKAAWGAGEGVDDGGRRLPKRGTPLRPAPVTGGGGAAGRRPATGPRAPRLRADARVRHVLGIKTKISSGNLVPLQLPSKEDRKAHRVYVRELDRRLFAEAQRRALGARGWRAVEGRPEVQAAVARAAMRRKAVRRQIPAELLGAAGPRRGMRVAVTQKEWDAVQGDADVQAVVRDAVLAEAGMQALA